MVTNFEALLLTADGSNAKQVLNASEKVIQLP